MIVVVGQAAFRPDLAGAGRAAAAAPEIAAAAAAAGATVELVAKIGEDGVGEELLLALAREGVGHLAVLRDPAVATPLAAVDLSSADEAFGDAGRPVAALVADVEAAAPQSPAEAAALRLPVSALEPADVSLGLRYLRDYRVVVAAEPLADGVAAAIAEAAAFAGAAIVVVSPPGAALPAAYGAATVFEAPWEDPDGAFARLVGRYASALDGGAIPGDAFRAATAEGGWEPAAG